MEKFVKGIYRVADCEHFGDVYSDAQYLRSLGCVVEETYWDRKDCGEAYVKFKVREYRFPYVYKIIHSSASFDADINDYIKPDFFMDNFIKLSKDEFSSLLKNVTNDFGDGFEKRIPILLFFDKKENMDSESIIKEILSNFKTYKPLGYNVKIVDGTTYIDLLFTVDYMELQNDIFKKIGDSCLSSLKNSIIKNHGLYGECKPYHEAFNMCHWDYELTRRLIDKILKKESITYSCRRLANPTRFVEIPYSDYMTDGKLRDSVTDRNGYEYEFYRFSL